ncbi:MAG: hypothetical protein JO358_05595 [Alphaproteobacteria bacterium]|nr:hypothetical protein [Alphaproteobacteria bacterium]
MRHLKVAAATWEAWPRGRKPLGMRITGCDWVEGGVRTDEAGSLLLNLRLRFLRRHRSAGAARCGGGLPGAACRRSQKGQGVAVQAVGMIVAPHHAEAIIAGEQADLVTSVRGF